MEKIFLAITIAMVALTLKAQYNVDPQTLIHWQTLSTTEYPTFNPYAFINSIAIGWNRGTAGKFLDDAENINYYHELDLRYSTIYQHTNKLKILQQLDSFNINPRNITDTTNFILLSHRKFAGQFNGQRITFEPSITTNSYYFFPRSASRIPHPTSHIPHPTSHIPHFPFLMFFEALHKKFKT